MRRGLRNRKFELTNEAIQPSRHDESLPLFEPPGGLTREMSPMTFTAARLILILITVLPAACSLSPNLDQAERQRLAISRWERCVNEQADRLHLSRSLAKQDASMVCEGYRRDVLDTYPPHLTPRINDLLIDRTEDRLATSLTRRASRLITYHQRCSALPAATAC